MYYLTLQCRVRTVNYRISYPIEGTVDDHKKTHSDLYHVSIEVGQVDVFSN